MLATWQYYLVGWINLHNHLVFLLKSLYANRGHEGPKFVASNSLVSSFPTSNKSFFIELILPQYRYGIKGENNEGKGEVFSWRDRCD
mgnify:CR=1 FL=1